MRRLLVDTGGPRADLGGSLTNTGGLANIGEPLADKEPHVSLADIDGSLADVGGPLAHGPTQKTL